MKTATLYTVTAQEVQLTDSFTHSRNAAGPAHFLGDGHALAGVQQQPAGHVFALGDGWYAVMSPELRQVLEAPILLAAEDDSARHLAEVLRELAARPLLVRLWWALAGDCSPWEWLAGRVKKVRLHGGA